MHLKLGFIGLLTLILMIASIAIVSGEDPKFPPDVTPQSMKVDPGKEFELEVTIKAKVNSTYILSFQTRPRFSFPGNNYKAHDMVNGDAILFEVLCKVDSDAPDGDYNISFSVTWEFNGTQYKIDDTLKVKVGEGSKTEGNTCSSVIMIGAVMVISMSLLMFIRKENNAY